MAKCRVNTNAAHVSRTLLNDSLWINELQRKKKKTLQTIMLTYVAKHISSVNGKTLISLSLCRSYRLLFQLLKTTAECGGFISQSNSGKVGDYWISAEVRWSREGKVIPWSAVAVIFNFLLCTINRRKESGNQMQFRPLFYHQPAMRHDW